MLQGTAGTDVRRGRVWRRAATGLLAAGVCVATGLGAATIDTASGPVTRAVLGDSPGSLVGAAAIYTPPSPSVSRGLPAPATVVEATGAGRVARPALTAGDIPAAAWQAYLNAATVLAEAAPRCRLDWTVLAAIGLAESDHGRSPSGTGHDPVARRAARDTDGGRLDGDATRDVPVGPMRILPSTWQVVGVDGDGDGVRSPADADDSALAVGVALCAGDARLGTTAGLRRALLRYAPSPAYADLVIGIARSYAQAGTSVPTATVTAIAHPIVEGTATTLARRSLAHRVRSAGVATAKALGVGSSPSAQLLAAAVTSAGPRPAATGPSRAPSASSTTATAAPEPAATEPAASEAGPADPTPGRPTTTAVPAQDPTQDSPAPAASGSPADSPADPSPAAPAASEPPADGTPADGTPADGTPADGTPADGTPAETCPAPEATPSASTAPSPGPGTTTDPQADPSTDPTAQPGPCAEAPSADALPVSEAPRTAGAPAATEPPPATDETVSPPSPSNPAVG